MKGANVLPLKTLAVLGAALLPSLAHAQLDTDQDGVADHVDVFPCDPSRSAVVYLPSQDTHGVLMFEDQWPSQGDLDFNDVVLGYNYAVDLDAQGNVRFLRGTFNVLAIGGDFENGLGLQLPVPASAVGAGIKIYTDSSSVAYAPVPSDAQATFRLSDNLREFFADQAGPINSDAQGTQRAAATFEFLVEFVAPAQIDLTEAPFDLFLFRTGDPTHEIHAPAYGGTNLVNAALFNTADDGSDATRHYVDRSGLPFVLDVPSDVAWPAEAEAVSDLWPDIVDFAASGGATNGDFYASTVQASFAYAPAAGRPTPAFGTPNAVPSEVASCLPAYALGTYRYGTPLRDYTRATGQMSNGDVVLVGDTAGDFGGAIAQGSYDVAMLRYDATTGTTAWARSFGSSGTDFASVVAVTPSDDLIVGLYMAAPVQVDGIAVPSGYSFARFDGAGNLQWAQPGYAVIAISAEPDGGFVAWSGTNRIVYDASGVEASRSTPTSAGNQNFAEVIAHDGDRIVVSQYYYTYTSCYSYRCGWSTCSRCNTYGNVNYKLERFDPTLTSRRWSVGTNYSYPGGTVDGLDGTVYQHGPGTILAFDGTGAQVTIASGLRTYGRLALEPISGDLVSCVSTRDASNTEIGTWLTRVDTSSRTVDYATFSFTPGYNEQQTGCYTTPGSVIVPGSVSHYTNGLQDFFVGQHDLATGLRP